MSKKLNTVEEYMAAKIRAKELENNPAVRTPLAMVLDISGSMAGTPIEQLNRGAQMLLHEILANVKAKNSVEVCVIAYDHEINCIREFGTIRSENEIPAMTTRSGATYTGSAVHAALDRLEARKAEYAEKGVEYYQPWLVLISDGEPYGEDPSVTESAVKRIADMTAAKDLTAYTVGVGERINQETLQRFSPASKPMHIDTIDQFQSLFSWISASVIRVASQKTPYAAPENVCRWEEFRP